GRSAGIRLRVCFGSQVLLLAGIVLLRPGAHVQADAGDASLPPVAAGFLAIEPLQNHCTHQAGDGKGAFFSPFSRHFHRYDTSPKRRRRGAHDGQLFVSGPRGKRADLVLPISGEIILAGKPPVLLSASGSLAPDGGGRRRVSVAGSVRFGLGDAARSSLPVGGLVLVHRDPGAGDW